MGQKYNLSKNRKKKNERAKEAPSGSNHNIYYFRGFDAIFIV